MGVSPEPILLFLKPKVGQKIQMEGAQLILMNAAPKSAKVPQIGAPLIHLLGASIHLEVFGVDPALKDTQVSNLYTFYTANYLFLYVCSSQVLCGFFFNKSKILQAILLTGLKI
jgi:hypothetical protein